MGSNCSNLSYVDPNVTYEVWASLGPRCLDQKVALPTVVIYCLILILGVFGNCTTCMVILRNRSMHNATNYYLFSLAISDLVQLLFGLPFELESSVGTLYPFPYPSIICKGRAFVTEFCGYASILTITAFSVERWLAICFPLKIQLFSKLNRATKVIVFIWLVSLVAALPFGFAVIINRLPIPDYVSADIIQYIASPYNNMTVKDTEYCGLDTNDKNIHTILLNFSFWVFFVVPLLLISALYLHIGITIRSKGQTLGRNHSTYRKKAERNRRTVLRMLVAVVLAFFICWLPFHAQRIMTIYIDMANIDMATQRFCNIVFFLSGYFYYANSALNPLLYNAFSNKFRSAFLRTVCPACVRQCLRSLHITSAGGFSTVIAVAAMPKKTNVSGRRKTTGRGGMRKTLGNLDKRISYSMLDISPALMVSPDPDSIDLPFPKSVSGNPALTDNFYTETVLRKKTLSYGNLSDVVEKIDNMTII